MNLSDIKKYQNELNVIFKKNNVVLVYIFGSVAKGRENFLSDIDIAVLFSKKVKKDNYFNLRIKIAGEIDRALKTGKTEVICLNKTSPFLKHEAVCSGVVIYCSDVEIKRYFELSALQDYEDFKYHLNIGSDIIKSQIKNGIFGKPLIPYKSKYLEKYVSSK